MSSHLLIFSNYASVACGCPCHRGWPGRWHCFEDCCDRPNEPAKDTLRPAIIEAIKKQYEEENA